MNTYPPPPLRDLMAWLEPIPNLHLRHSDHTYWLGDHLFHKSTTGVLSFSKGRVALAQIEATRSEWAPRGTAIHKALEVGLLGRFHPDGDRGASEALLAAPEFDPYREWIDPLLSHHLWDAVQVCASEMALCDLDRNIAGTFDGAYETPTGTRVLFDLKTQKRPDASPYCTKAQLGCYIGMAEASGLHFDRAVTIWSKPGRVMVQRHPRDECLDAWEKAWDAYAEASLAL